MIRENVFLMDVIEKYKYVGTEMRISRPLAGRVPQRITIRENTVILSQGGSDDGPKPSAWKTASDRTP